MNKRKDEDYLSIPSDIQKSQANTPILSDQEQEIQIQPLQFLYITPNLFTPLWPNIRAKLLELTQSSSITSFQTFQLIENIYALHFSSKSIKSKINFINLQAAINEFEFKNKLLNGGIQLFAKLALRIESEFKDYVPMLHDTVSLTHEQCAILVANMFFCTLHLQPDYHHLPSTFIFAKLFNNCGDDNQLKVQKIKCFLHYILSGSLSQQKVTFTRRKGKLQTKEMRLCEFVYSEAPNNAHMEDVQDCYIVDFANSKIGGGVLSLGCVQEEILFLIHPEVIVILLFTTEIQKDEAVIIEGIERLIAYSGYRSTFKCEGIVNARQINNLICIDAQDYNTNRHHQYSDFQQEIQKAYIGFKGIQNICTGKWGCGVFGGEWQLKALIQWVAASFAGTKRLIFVNDQSYLMNQAFKQLEVLSTYELYQLIVKYCYLKSNNLIDLKIEAIDYILLQL